MRDTSGKKNALVITLGSAHERPWWWDQLEGSPLRDRIRYERIVFGGRQQQMGMARLVRRLHSLLRSARRERIEYVFTFESDWSCYFIALLQYLPWLARTPRHVIVQFISREHDGSLKSALKDFTHRMFLRTVHRVVCSSQSEASYYRERFGWGPAKTLFVPLHSDARLLEVQPSGDGEYIIAAGRSYRDYETLARAVAGTGIRTIIVCGRRGPGVKSLPPEVEIVSEIPFPVLTERMANARIVVLPLENKRISTGQSVLLQGMALGRPVIATRTAGTEDYIRDGETGLLVGPGAPDELRQAITKLWSDEISRKKLGAAAKAAVAERFLPMHYAAEVARELGCEAGVTSAARAPATVAGALTPR